MLLRNDIDNKTNIPFRRLRKVIKRHPNIQRYARVSFYIVILIVLIRVIAIFKWFTQSTSSSVSNVAFFIQVSNSSILLLPRLLRAIYHPQNVYIIHFDYKISYHQRNTVSTLLLEEQRYSENVHIMESESVSYAGVSMVLNTINAISQLLKMSDQWQYFINLSASDYPLVSPQTLRYLFGDPSINQKPINFLQHQIADKDINWFFDRRISRTHIDTSLWTTMFSSKLHNSQHSKQGSLIDLQVTHPITSQMPRIPFVKSEAWVILHRSFCEYVVDSSQSRRLLLTYATSRASDELFFGTLLSISSRFRDSIAWDSLRYIRWSQQGVKLARPAFVDSLQDENIVQEVIQSGALFARKFQNTESSLLDYIDANMTGLTKYDYLRNDLAIASYEKRAWKRLHCIVTRRVINSCGLTDYS